LSSKICFIFLFAMNLSAKEMSFFSSKINYWENNKESLKQEKLPIIKKKEKHKKFSWKKYLNPENDEFFQEGNYKPPAPFMELARRRTKKNKKTI
jgi:hypothetical protein